MAQDAYNLASFILSIVTLLATVIGLLAVYIQIQKVKESLWSNVHSKLCDQSFELIKFFSENPNTYDYFYHNKRLDEKETEKVKILYATEIMANFLEHLLLQKENLPKKQWLVWERFIASTLSSSIIVCQFVQGKKEWYSSDLLAIVDKCNPPTTPP
ncbi:hypothetical protein BH09BAC1_BH09BAC1_00750 [soil metagenome]